MPGPARRSAPLAPRAPGPRFVPPPCPGWVSTRSSPPTELPGPLLPQFPGVSEDTPGGLPHPGWHGLTFPEDAVHAVQGVGIAGRSERGSRQGLRLPSTTAPSRQLQLPGPRHRPRHPRAPPVRCCPPAATRTPGPGNPRPAAPDAHSLAPQGGRLLHVVLHPVRQSTRGEAGARACCPPPPSTGGPGQACPCSGQRPSRRTESPASKGTRKRPPAPRPPGGPRRGLGPGAVTLNSSGPLGYRAPRRDRGTNHGQPGEKSGTWGASHHPNCCHMPATSVPHQWHRDTGRTDLTFTMSAGVPTNPPVKPAAKEEPGSGGSSSLREPRAEGGLSLAHLPPHPAALSGRRGEAPGCPGPSGPSRSHRWQSESRNMSSGGEGG